MQGTTHTGTTTRCRTQRRNPLRSERPQPYPPHTGGTFHRRLQPLYTEKRTVSCSGFLPSSPLRHRFPTTSLRYKPCHSLFFFCDVLWCDVKSQTTLHWVYCYVMYCYVMFSLTPPFIECVVMWCDVLLCDVKSHTTLHWVYCYVMYC